MSKTPQGIIISVKVKPASSRFSFSVKGQDCVLEIKSPAREGKANQEILKELARLFRCQVKILSGSSSKSKLILLKGITEQELDLVLKA